MRLKGMSQEAWDEVWRRMQLQDAVETAAWALLGDRNLAKQVIERGRPWPFVEPPMGTLKRCSREYNGRQALRRSRESWERSVRSAAKACNRASDAMRSFTEAANKLRQGGAGA